MTDATFETEADQGATAAPAVRIPITVKHYNAPPEGADDLTAETSGVEVGDRDDITSDTDEAETADGPHQGQRDIGGYVPTNLIEDVDLGSSEAALEHEIGHCMGLRHGSDSAIQHEDEPTRAIQSDDGETGDQMNGVVAFVDASVIEETDGADDAGSELTHHELTHVAQSGDGTQAAPAVRIPITIKHHVSPPEEVDDITNDEAGIDATGESRETINQLTSFIDASSVHIHEGDGPTHTADLAAVDTDATQSDEDDHDIIFDPDGDLMPPNTPVDPVFDGSKSDKGADLDAAAPAVRIPITIKHHDTPPQEADDITTEDPSTADGPHQGKRDIGGYVPSTIITPTPELNDDASLSDASGDSNRDASGIMQSVEPTLDGTEQANIKGVSWFGFDTSPYNTTPDQNQELTNPIDSKVEEDAATGSSGHFTQMVWADTRYELDGGATDLIDQRSPLNDVNLIEGTQGHEEIHGTQGRDDIHAYGGHDYVLALGGDDYVNGGNGSDEIFGGNGHDILNGAAGFDTLDGGTGDDVLSGGSDDDRLFGGSDNDLLRGGEGADWIEGGSGADVHYWGHGDTGQDNVYDFELGVDTLDFSDGFFSTAPGETLNDVLFAFENGNDTQLLANTSWGGLQILGTFHEVNASDMQVRIDNGTILEVGIRVEGGPGGLVPNQHDPFGGAPSSGELVTEETETDERDPGADLDVPAHAFVGISLIGTDEGDLMVSTDPAEVFFAGDDEDIVNGDAGDNQIFGGHDGDTLLGGEDDDFLSGGSGSVQLTGGDGADTFHFEAATGFMNIPGLDTITDFEIGVDRFDFEDGFFAEPPGDALSDNLIAIEGAGGAQLFADVDFWGLTQTASARSVTGVFLRTEVEELTSESISVEQPMIDDGFL